VDLRDDVEKCHAHIIFHSFKYRQILNPHWACQLIELVNANKLLSYYRTRIPDEECREISYVRILSKFSSIARKSYLAFEINYPVILRARAISPRICKRLKLFALARGPALIWHSGCLLYSKRCRANDVGEISPRQAGLRSPNDRSRHRRRRHRRWHCATIKLAAFKV